MSKCNHCVNVAPNELSIWRTDRWAPECRFLDIKASIRYMPPHYERLGLTPEDFNIEIDDKCLYITSKKELDSDIYTLPVDIEWDNGLFRIPVPSMAFSDPDDEKHRLSTYSHDNWFTEPIEDMRGEDGHISVQKVVKKMLSVYLRYRETFNYDTDWEYNLPQEYFKENIDKMYPGSWDIMINFIKEKCGAYESGLF